MNQNNRNTTKQKALRLSETLYSKIKLDVTVNSALEIENEVKPLVRLYAGRKSRTNNLEGKIAK